MTYSDLYHNYRNVLKAYPEIGNLCEIPGILGKCETIKYEKHGKSWKEISRKTEDLTSDYYLNSITAIPFFRSLGGSERVERGYCVRGYLPLTITSVSPDGAMKTKRIFKF